MGLKCLIREVSEELNYSLTPGEILDSTAVYLNYYDVSVDRQVTKFEVFKYTSSLSLFTDNFEPNEEIETFTVVNMYDLPNLDLPKFSGLKMVINRITRYMPWKKFVDLLI